MNTDHDARLARALAMLVTRDTLLTITVGGERIELDAAHSYAVREAIRKALQKLYPEQWPTRRKSRKSAR